MTVVPFDYETHLEQCAARSERAFQTLYDTESGRMLGLATRMMGRRDEAEEILHDAFVQIWNNAARYDRSVGGGRAWIYSVLRYRVLDRLRQRGEAPEGDDALAMVADEGPGPEAQVESAKESRRLDKCLEHLPDDRRGAIFLAYFNGLSHGQIAQRLAIPLGTIKSRIRAGLRALQECLST